MASESIMRIRKSEVSWNTSSTTSNWHFAILRSEPLKGKVFGGLFTLWFRCGEEVHYQPWISDGPVEYFITKGTLNVNGCDVSEGDYARVPPNTD